MTDTTATHRSIELDVFIAASPETVWEYWVDPVRMCEWWGIDADLRPEPGGVYRVVMSGGPVMLGEYVELDPPERLVFLFGWEAGIDAVPPRSTRVEVALAPENDGTRLTLRHSELPAGADVEHRKGWENVLHVLVDVANAN